MKTAAALGDARIISSGEFEFEPVPGTTGSEIATPVSPAAGATHVTLHVVRIAAGDSWSPEDTAAEENTAVVYAGSGLARVGTESHDVSRASAVYAPTGRELTLTAADEGLTAYVWRPARRRQHPGQRTQDLLHAVGRDDPAARLRRHRRARARRHPARHDEFRLLARLRQQPAL